MRTSFLYTLALLLSLSGLCFQCSDSQTADTTTAQQTKTFGQFDIQYLAPERQLRGQARFFQGDSLHSASPIKTKSPLFMGANMKEQLLVKEIIRYEGRQQVDYPTNFKFSFQTADAPEMSHAEISMPEIGEFSILSASKKDGLKIELNSNISSEESIILLFTTPKQEARTIVKPGPINNKELYIPADALLHFEAGHYKLYLVKKKRVHREDQDLIADFNIEYYSKETSFDLVTVKQ